MQTTEIQNTLDERSDRSLQPGFSASHSEAFNTPFWATSDNATTAEL